MNEAYRNGIQNAGASLVTHIGLVNGSGTAVSTARVPVTWTAAAGGLIRPTADLEISVGAGTTVAGWRGYSALTGGTDYGGEALTAETFNDEGTYDLRAAETSIQLPAV